MKLKITFLSLCLMIGCYAVRAQESNFNMVIKMAKPKYGFKAFLQYGSTKEMEFVDSAAYKNGKFEIKGTTPYPQRAYLYIAPENKGFSVYKNTVWRIPVYVEKGKILVSVADELKDAKLSGTPLNDVFQGHADVVKAFSPRLEVLKSLFRKAYQDKDSNTITLLNPKFKKLELETRKAEEEYFLANLNSPVSVDWLKNSFILAKDKSKVVELFDKMGDEAKNSAIGRNFAKSLNAVKSVEIGDLAPDFLARNLKDEEVSLSSFKGKYVLLDFWASWCFPCRKENPNVLKAYHEYKSKNFTVVGYTLDSDRKAWENAVVKDGMPWAQLSSFGIKNERVDKLYGVTGIPDNFLIDPSGKIIATNLRGEELFKQLEKFIN